MKRLADPRLWLGLASLALVLLVFRRDVAVATSPGPLSPTHERVAELTGPAPESCEACHGLHRSQMAAACAACHDDVSRQIARGTGFHGTMRSSEGSATDCARCHLEHHGSDLDLVTRASFARAGVPDPDAYDHGGLAFQPAGFHAELACEACHPNADRDVLDAGEARFAGLVPSCAGCHADPHEGRFERACEACHAQDRAFDDLGDFAHERFALVGAHAGLGCLACHERSSPHAIERIADADPPVAVRACQECHDSPHAEGFVRAVAAELALAPEASCAKCHDARDPALEGGLAGGFARGARLERALHAATGFALGSPHEQASCNACHPVGASFAERYPGRVASDCGVCHADPHEGQFAGGAFLAAAGRLEGDCLACHAPEAFAPPEFGLEEHALTTFPLRGAHRAVACALCHETRTPGGARRFRGTAEACASCHADVHGGLFDGGSAAALAEALGGEPLERADPGGCARCHVESSFGDVDRREFDHAWTGFVLQGVHATLDCASCHPRAPHPDERGRTFALARGTSCEDCHVDPHAGQFAAGGRTDCARCHDERASFAALDFDHGRDSRFALDARHASLSCSACHVPWPLPEGGEVVRYKPLGTSCQDCHGRPGGGR